MGKITFILGGARSGKSAHAVKLAKKYKKVAFVATCRPLDEEMRSRIALHKIARPKNWKTFERPRNMLSLLEKIGDEFDCILIDCLTIYASNLILKKFKENAVEREVNRILSALKKTVAESIIVSNEVGLGIVPPNKLARGFRDIAGRINQIVALKSSRVFFMVSGIPWRVK